VKGRISPQLAAILRDPQARARLMTALLRGESGATVTLAGRRFTLRYPLRDQRSAESLAAAARPVRSEEPTDG
jgi:hypothetical protein